MSVTGFLVDNEVQKYDYESLDNYNTPDFSTSSTYKIGDYVMYQGKLYKCTTAITTGGAWDSSKWILAILSDDVANLRNSVESGEYGLSELVKQAILQIARKVAYVDDQGQTYYDDLYDALYPSNVVSITALYTQSGTVYDTDTLDSLKADLVVTAFYSDSSTQTVAVEDYTLSGTLTEGTSTITVSYGGKTTTFDVTVTNALDKIAYGSLTYRDIFITNNEVIIGDFEIALELSNKDVALGNGRYYKINAGSPIQTTEQYDSPTHSLKCFGTSSTQIVFSRRSKVYSQNYLVCCSANVSRYVSGYAGVQAAYPYNTPTKISKNVGFQRTTNGFEHMVGIVTVSGDEADRRGMRFFIGSYSSANLDCYVDDAICTPVPSEMTETEALALYEEYLSIVRRNAA